MSTNQDSTRSWTSSSDSSSWDGEYNDKDIELDEESDGDGIVFEELDEFEQWLFNANRHDNIQLEKWRKYFNPALTMDQIRTSDRLRRMPSISSITEDFDYVDIFKKNEQLMKTWKLENSPLRNIWKERDLNLRIDVLNTVDKGLIGFNFFNEIIRRHLRLLEPNPSKKLLRRFQNDRNHTFINDNGSFYEKYCFTIPALFLQHHLQTLQNEHLDFHVVCQGFKFESVKNVLGYEQRYNVYAEQLELMAVRNYDKQIQAMVTSETVRRIRQNPIDSQRYTIRRICFWINTKDHVFVVCWDEYAVPTVVQHMLSIIDNMYPESMVEIDQLREAFEKAIRLIEKEESYTSDTDSVVSDQSNQIYYIKFQWYNLDWTRHVPFEKDFICVSFMARCTLYLSMFEGAIFNFKFDKKLYENKPLLEHLQMVYRQFEIDLYCFTRDRVNKGYIVLFPSTLNTRYLEVNQITLMTMDVHGNCKEYRYYGIKYRFKSVDWKPPTRDEDFGCYISSAASL